MSDSGSNHYSAGFVSRPTTPRVCNELCANMLLSYVQTMCKQVPLVSVKRLSDGTVSVIT